MPIALQTLLKDAKVSFGLLVKGEDISTTNPFVFRTTGKRRQAEHTFFDEFPRFVEWVDEVKAKTLKTFPYTYDYKDFQASVIVHKNDLEDLDLSEASTNLKQQVMAIAKSWVAQADEEINTLFINNGNAFDGTAYFADTRPNIEGSNTIDNIVTGTGTTYAQFVADFESAYGQLVAIRSNANRPMNAAPKLHLFVPAQLAAHARTLQMSENHNLGDGAITNVWRSQFEYTVNYFQLSSNNDWYMINVNAPAMPVIWSERKKPEWSIKDEADSLTATFVAHARGAAGYGNPMSIIFVNN